MRASPDVRFASSRIDARRLHRAGARCGWPAGRAQPRRAGRGAQGGVAALEFALVLSVFLLVFAGIVGLGATMWAQQTLTSAASEGARAVLDSGLGGALDTSAGCRAARGVATWMNVTCKATPQACAWQSPSGKAVQCMAISLGYDTAEWPLLASVRSLSGWLGGSGWVPTVLNANAVVQIQESS